MKAIIKGIDLVNNTITVERFEDIPADIYKADELTIISTADYEAQQAALARKDAALEAADKKIITARALAKDAMLKGQLPENEHAIKLVNADIELCGARALIAAALKEEEVKK